MQTLTVFTKMHAVFLEILSALAVSIKLIYSLTFQLFDQL